MSNFLKENFLKISLRCLIVLLMVQCHTLIAQTADQYIQQGDKSFVDADYYTAFYYYNQARQIDSTEIEASYKMGESSRKFNDYQAALRLYEKVLKVDKYKNFPLSEFWMGMMEKYLGNYDKSKEYYYRFLNRYSFQDYYKKKATQELESSAWIIDHYKITDTVKIQRMGNEINTQFSEFAASELQDSFYQFSSIREEPSALQKNNKEFLSRIYTMKLENNVWKENKDLFDWLNTYNKHIANGSFSEDGKRFYFNVCENKNISDLRCDIFVSNLVGQHWEQPIKLADAINVKDATNTQPYEAENKILYFVSDRKGGEGKLDIWYSLRSESGTYEAPINLGKVINSPDDEITPFYDSKNAKLYFSSEWYYGYGGFDVFYARKKASLVDFEEPENACLPINSSCNDIYFNFNASKQEGYLSSNRKGSLFLKGESCCNDIYKLAFKSSEKVVDTSTMLVNTNVRKDTGVMLTQIIVTKEDSIKTSSSISLEKIKKLLPVTVYFHNDIPEPRSLSDTTLINYRATYDEYTVMRDEYQNEYKKIVKQKQDENDIALLFDNNIDEGYRKLLLFTTYLKQQLSDTGKVVTLTIEGYCSPLALNDYNVHLANRRIASLKNYINDFDNGVFKKYLIENKLIYRNAPYGEERADQRISDDRLDLPRSVYQPKAALERRVAIIDVSAN